MNLGRKYGGDEDYRLRSRSRSRSLSPSSDDDSMSWQYMEPSKKLMVEDNTKLLNKLLASLLVLRNNTHTYHWFIRGKNFVEVHQLLNQQYDQILLNADRLAEYLIANKFLDDTSLTNCIKISVVSDRRAKFTTKPVDMISDLLNQHKQIYSYIKDIPTNSRVLDNILADLQEYHKKQIWFLESILSE
jgi:starvation-inducible DNA-binding protein